MRILFLTQDWDYRFARPQQLALQLRNLHQVSYVATSPGLRTRLLDAWRGQTRLRPLSFRPVPGIRAVCALYFRDTDSVARLVSNQARFATCLGTLFPHMVRATELVIVTHPIDAGLLFHLFPGLLTADRLEPSPGVRPQLVYDCLDRYEDFYPKDSDLRGHVINSEQTLLARADHVFVSSRRLEEDKSRLRPVHYLPHGVEPERFAAAHPLPSDLAALPTPRVGFVGAIETWLDLGWLRAVAEGLPKVSLVMVGDVRTDLQGLDRLPNLHFLGARPYPMIPAYIQAFDVCIVPFKINRLTEAVNPVKVLEYLAAGKPVVSSYMPELESYLPCIRLVHTQAEFRNAIEESLRPEEPQMVAARRGIASNRSWAAMAQKFMAVIDGRITLDALRSTQSTLHATRNTP